MKCSRKWSVSLACALSLAQVALPVAGLARTSLTPRSGASGVLASATALAGGLAAPIGTIESTGTVLINGRPAGSNAALWDGELVQAPANAPASLSLAALGQLQLAQGTLVRISSTAGPMQPQRRLLVAQVLEGAIELQTQPAVGAYLEAGGRSWLVSGAATLSLSARAGAATLESANGAISELRSELGNWSLQMPAFHHATNAPGAANAALLKTNEQQSAQQMALLRSLRLANQAGTLASNEPLKLQNNSRAAMIGMLATASGATINGRTARAQEMLWENEQVQTSAQAAAQLSLGALGSVQLAKASALRLASATVVAGVRSRRVLTASLETGEMHLKLAPEVAAYLETNGKSFTAEPGSRFRISTEHGTTAVEVFAGNVREIGDWMMALSGDVLSGATAQRAATAPRQYTIRQLKAETLRPSGVSNAGKLEGVAETQDYLLRLQPNAQRQLRFLVTDRAGKPAAGVPVVFTLNPGFDQETAAQAMGRLGKPNDNNTGRYLEVQTDAQGIAHVPFTAGSASGSVSLSASVRDTNTATNNVVVVNADDDDDDEKFWRKRNAIPVFATVGAAVVTGIVVYLTRDERFPIRSVNNTPIIVP